jgi:hypothetical protein
VVYNPGAMFSDPNVEILKQLTRIADALNKPQPSPWVEWVRNLASLIAGGLLAMFSIKLQTKAHDTVEHKRMRRIIYRELAANTLEVYGIVRAFSNETVVAGPKDVKRGYKDPPAFEILNPPWTFDGEEYMQQNRSVAYELPEMVFLKRMYVEFHHFEAGRTVPIGQFKSVLKKISTGIKTNPVVRQGFKKFADTDVYKSIHAIADHFVGVKLPIEEFVRQVFKEDSADNQRQEARTDPAPQG